MSVQHPVTPAGSCPLRVPEARGTKENQLKGHGSACHQPLRAPHFTERPSAGVGVVLGSTCSGEKLRDGMGGGGPRSRSVAGGRRMSVSSKTDILDLP